MPEQHSQTSPSRLETEPDAHQDPLRILDHAAQQVNSVARDIDHLERLATLGTISASVAHEINNLLTPVIAYAQLARGRHDDPEMLHKALQKASQGAEAVSAIARAMLSFARPDAGEEQRADVRTAVDHALDCLARHPAKDGFRLLIDIEPDCAVLMQPLCLQQVMMNLIANSIQAMKRSKAGETLEIAAETKGRTVEIRLTDNGPGIPAEVAESLFEPFKSSQPAESGSNASGFGLGLWICQRLIRQAGGEIAVLSPPNQGATFVVTLPAACQSKQNPSIDRAAG